MTHISKTKTLLLGAVAVLSLGVMSCRKDFLDINSNPNTATSASITPELIFPSAAVRSAALQGGGSQTFLNNWMGYTGASGDFVPDLVETRYDESNTFNTGNWTTRYDILFDLFQTKNLALAKGDSVLAGASMILSDKLWQELVDLYGNIPYTDAFHIERTSTPTYDNAASIYVALEADLDKAISYMHGTPSGSYQSTIGAVIHFGAGPGSTADLPKWRRFANTLKLRMLIRTSEVTVTGLNRTAELAKITAEGGVLQSGETVNVNPGYSNDAGKQSPYYGNFGFTSTGIDASSIVRANKYSVDSLSARNDPRLRYFYRGIGATGAVPNPATAIVGVSYGATTNPGGSASSKVGVGTATSSTQDAWILTSTESLFLYAEAIQRGWLTGSTPAAAYANAVTESFIQLGVPSAATAAATYMANNPLADFANANATITNSSGTFTFTPVKFILYQKYIALNQFDPLESYSDLRRINFMPDNGYISKNANRLASVLPNRLIYPQEEYTLNLANVSAQGTIDHTTIFTPATKLFWQP